MNTSRLKNIKEKEWNNCFTNCKIPNIKTDGRLMALNDKHLIMAWNDEPGSIKIVNPNKPFKMDPEINIFSFEESHILDMEFSHFDSNIFYFSNENNNIYITKITEQNEILSDFSYCYDSHSSEVYFIDSNPVASNVICSSTLNGEIHIWDSVRFKKQIDLKVSPNINDIHWNPNGSLIGYSTSNKLLTIIDPRNSHQILEDQITEINSKTKFVWLGDYSLATIGYKIVDKQLYLNLYDIRQTIKNPFSSINISSGSSSLTPFVDPELKLIYITAKDDNKIYLYDYDSGNVKKYGDYRTSEKSNFSIQLNRKYLNKKYQEIDRFARYTKSNKIFFFGFLIKDKNTNYNNLYYPSEESYSPKMTSEEWFS